MISREKLLYIAKEIFSFLTNKRFLLNILGIILFLSIVLFGVFTWLRMYTNHGQKLELPNYVGDHIESSTEDATSRSFEIIVNDSVHIVGKNGGLIQIQNPPGGSLVKENRKIYVTITKYKADKVTLGDLRFYGEDFNQVTAQLKTRNIYTNIKAKEFDAINQNSVLEVWHNGKLVVDRRKSAEGLVIDKGDTLDFVISSSQGGTSEVPDLIGKSVSAADLILKSIGLKIAIEYGNDNVLDQQSEGDAEIIMQYPPDGTDLPRGSTITVKVKGK